MEEEDLAFKYQNIVPIHVLLKYNPPELSIIYKNNKKDKKKRMFKILLNDDVLACNSKQITQKLYSQFPYILDNKKIPSN